MTYELYNWIFIGGAILAGLMLVLAAVLFFVLKIPSVIGDLSGATARKAIEGIRSQNTATGEKVHKTSAVNKERGKVTDKISHSGRLKPKYQDVNAGGMPTAKIGTQKLKKDAEGSAAYAGFEETVVETTVLAPAAAETTVLAPAAAETTVLWPQGNETTVLMPETQNAYPMAPAPGGAAAFAIVYELTEIHSDEEIN